MVSTAWVCIYSRGDRGKLCHLKLQTVIIVIIYMTWELLRVRMEALCLPPRVSWLKANVETLVYSVSPQVCKDTAASGRIVWRRGVGGGAQSDRMCFAFTAHCYADGDECYSVSAHRDTNAHRNRQTFVLWGWRLHKYTCITNAHGREEHYQNSRKATRLAH